MTDAEAVRELITSWVDAVQSGDLEGVLRQHHPDVMMFDVPPPHRGVRGIDEYRDSWGPFFDWLRTNDVVFALDELEVMADDQVAFAYALVRCGSPTDLEANPDNRLRVTVGLRKVDGRWLVVHEHHSFPMT